MVSQSLRASFLRFTIVFVLGTAAAMAATYVLLRYTDLGRSSIFAFIPVMLASLDAGVQFHRRTGRRPEAAEMWEMALGFTLIGLAIGLLLAAILIGRGFVHVFSNPYVLLMISVMMVITAVASWLFIRLGAKGAAKARR